METTTVQIEKDNNLICKNDQPLPGNTVGPSLKLEEPYVAKEVITCTCGSKHVDVGLASEYNYIRCFECKENLPDGDKIHWCHPSRFEIQK